LEVDERHSDNMSLVKGLLVAALYPQIATVTKGRVNYNKAVPGEVQEFPLEFRTVELWGSKPIKKGNGALNDRPVALHPSSVLHNQRGLGFQVYEHMKPNPNPNSAFRSMSI